MSQAEQFQRVTAICEHLKAERGNTEHTPNEVVSVTTAYLLACDRTKRTHHLEDNPNECFASNEVCNAQQAAHDAVWSIIGDANTRTNAARYEAAWDVWGILLQQGDTVPGMARESFSA